MTFCAFGCIVFLPNVKKNPSNIEYKELKQHPVFLVEFDFNSVRKSALSVSLLWPLSCWEK